MRIRCVNGFFLVDEVRAGQVGRFISIFGMKLEPWRNVFTFPLLAEVPEYSIATADFLGIPATKTFAGAPWEIFEANQFVYDFDAGMVKPSLAITRVVQLVKSGNVYVSKGLFIPGSLLKSGERITGYTAWFDLDSMTFRYSGVTV